jgi:3-oxoacyl-[acyl-carrier protein] reductase
MREVNVDAGFQLSRGLARKLIAAKRPGSFLILTSLHAGTPRNLPHYSTSKAALTMLVKELAKTLGRFGIRVNALVPGAIVAGGFVADPGWCGMFRSAASAARRISRRWRWRSSRTRCRPT